MSTDPTRVAPARLQQIALARRSLASGSVPASGLAPWIERSWQRCLAQGRRPGERLGFDLVPAQALRRAEEAHHALLSAARPVMARLARAIAGSRYFALLTDSTGMVIAAEGAIDHGDRRAQLISRVGVDLSERAVGTTAIGAALTELEPVWLHRGEHFHDDTACYSCAGAPVFGTAGECLGMLDVTGIDAVERPELRHLVAQSARAIENALVLAAPHALLLRLNWPGGLGGGDDDGLLCLSAEGAIRAANRPARDMTGLGARGPHHCSDVFATPWGQLFDAALRGQPVEVPLWSGLRVQVQASRNGRVVAVPMPVPSPVPATVPAGALPLRDLETELIRRAVREARGNVMEAARVLGISRATIYRRLRRLP